MTGYLYNGCIYQDILVRAMSCLETGGARLLTHW
ncbi:hypothetical protein [Neptunicoccus cionae]